ncbi:MAG: PQQ-binding-like beta-propeller repeat protein [Verrucomicrobia bacterium]|nr:PQQ-binding-like beta-propeller repeat protein [Verrucomicrobiota bacterium]
MFRGPNHDGISTETEWKKTWPESGPKQLWETQVGIGFSSVSVADGRVFTLGNSDNKDTIVAFDAVSGKKVWSHTYDSKIGAKFYEGGPGSTPTIDGKHVYVLSKWGDLFCLDAANGSVIWKRQLEKEEGVRLPDWGFNGSPLIHEKMLILNVGGGGMAVDKANGKTIWFSNDEEAGYSTPLPFNHDGKSFIALSSGSSFLGAEITTGKKTWEIQWPTRYGVNAADPIIAGDEIWIGSGYNKGHGLYQFNGSDTEVKWTNRELRSQQNAPILINDHLFGFDGDGGSRAALKCIERSSGKVVWEADEFKYGAVAAAGDQLIIMTAQGELIIAPASPAGFNPTARAKVLDGKCWTVPVIANGLVYLRNSKGHVICLDLRP